MRRVVALFVTIAALIGLADPAMAETGPLPSPDRNGDGRTDFNVVRPVSSTVNRWFWQFSSGGTRVEDWGRLGDIEVPADYDGDRRTDLAVWRVDPVSGAGSFIVQSSRTGGVTVFPWGQAGDDPTVVGDYNGDGRADFAVYRQGEPSTWLVALSSGGQLIANWGETGDFPAPADYDGDGRMDMTIQRGSENGWAYFWINGTRAGVRVIPWGGLADFVVPGDYDGDGRDDLAIVRNQGGVWVWYVLRSSGAGPLVVSWGNVITDYLVMGDYTGDGRTDIAIWRAGSPAGQFWVRNSSTGALIFVPWGDSDFGDFPVVNFNVH